MRAFVAIAMTVGGLAGAFAGFAPARAADLPTGRSESYSTRSAGAGHRVAPLVIYDYQPGVIVRAYWRAPWRNRHYYPTTGTKPEIGRDEDLSAGAGGAPEPAESFYRSWSTSSAFMREAPRPSLRDSDQLPQNPAPLK